MSDAKTDQPKAQGPSKIAKLMLPLIAVINLATVGGGAFLVYKSTLGYQPPTLREPAAAKELEESRKDDEGDEAVLFTMPSFTVNLQGGSHRLIRVEMTFEMLDKDGFEEIVRNSPAVRDTIMRILNAKTFDDVETIQGKLFLKDQIAVSLNETMKAGVVKDIYFSQFLIQ
jgi:flagellar FliL protein